MLFWKLDRPYTETSDTIKTNLMMCILNILLQARDGKIAIEDMEGGTFTISNGGVFGSMFGTPIINPPQSAILGMHGIFDRPIAVDGKVSLNQF